jgi:hypothetical protein
MLMFVWQPPVETLYGFWMTPAPTDLTEIQTTGVPDRNLAGAVSVLLIASLLIVFFWFVWPTAYECKYEAVALMHLDGLQAAGPEVTGKLLDRPHPTLVSAKVRVSRLSGKRVAYLAQGQSYSLVEFSHGVQITNVAHVRSDMAQNGRWHRDSELVWAGKEPFSVSRLNPTVKGDTLSIEMSGTARRLVLFFPTNSVPAAVPLQKD